MPVPTRAFSFICGQDDFLVSRMGKKRFEELAGDTTDEFSREVVNGFAGNVDEVETALNRFREAVQTMPMFGGRRVVWLKDVNFLADSVTGKAETTLKCWKKYSTFSCCSAARASSAGSRFSSGSIW